MNLTYDDVAQILRMVDQDGVRELRLEHEDFSLVVRKEAPGTPGSAAGDSGSVPTLARNAKGAVTEPGASLADATAPPAESLHQPGDTTGAPSATAVALVAPMPGTFYRAPAPGEPPFVNVGDRVGPETVVCILDVMKLMNRLNAPCAGTVTAIIPGDGQAVTARHPLVWIEPDR